MARYRQADPPAAALDWRPERAEAPVVLAPAVHGHAITGAEAAYSACPRPEDLEF